MILTLWGCTKAADGAGDAAGTGKTEAAGKSGAVAEKADSGKQEDASVKADSGKAGDAAGKEDTGDGYAFAAGDVTVNMKQNASEILDRLGEPENYSETPSCAFEGIDKIYSYKGWDLYTYPDGDEDFVNSVYFESADIRTPEGVGPGSTVDDVKAAYGEDFEEEFDTYTYTKGQTRLQFITDGETVEAVEYMAVFDD